MTIDQIIKLVDAGFSKEDILSLGTINATDENTIEVSNAAPSPEEPSTPITPEQAAGVPDQDPAAPTGGENAASDEKYNELLNTVKELKNFVLKSISMPEPPSIESEVDKITAALISGRKDAK